MQFALSSWFSSPLVLQPPPPPLPPNPMTDCHTTATPDCHPPTAETVGGGSIPNAATPGKTVDTTKGKKRTGQNVNRRARSMSVRSVESTDREDDAKSSPKKKRGKGKVPRPPVYEEGEETTRGRHTRFPWHVDHYQPHLRTMAQQYAAWRDSKGADRTRQAKAVADQVFQTWGTHEDMPLKRFSDVSGLLN